MSQTLASSASFTAYTRLTSNSATSLYTASEGTTDVTSIVASQNSGTSVTLTLDVYDGTNTYVRRYLWTMGVDNEMFTLPHNWQLRGTSSNASGLIDVAVSFKDPSASGSPR